MLGTTVKPRSTRKHRLKAWLPVDTPDNRYVTHDGLRFNTGVSFLALVAIAATVLVGTSAAGAASPAMSFSGIAWGQTLSGKVTWTSNIGNVIPKRVTFSIDGNVAWTEHIYPYYFNGDHRQLNTATLSNGMHTFSSSAYMDGSSSPVVSLTVREAVWNGDDSSPPPPPPPASPTAPVSADVPTVSGTAVAGETLTASSGSWSGTAPFTYDYQWLRCDTGGAGCVDVSGATASTYSLVSADSGHTMRVAVTATNSVDSVIAQSDATDVVGTSSSGGSTGGSGSVGGSAATGSPWHWNAATAALDPSSASKISAFENYAVGSGTYFVAAVAWADASSGTASYSVPVTGQVIKSLTAPIPPGTRPGSTFDQSLTVRGSDGTDYDFSLADYNSSTGKIASADGAATVSAGAAFETPPGNANGARLPLRAGLITPDDIKSGAINHALEFSMPNVGSSAAVYPAEGAYAYTGSGLPFGAWVRLDPSVDVASLGLPPYEAEIAVALQKYGMFLRDVGSTLSILASDQVNQGGNAVDWPAVGVTLPIPTPSGVPYARAFSSAFPWSKLQVLQPPAH